MSDAARIAAAERILAVARALPNVRDQLVFIGAAVLPLLVDVDHRLTAPRPTRDVDAVAATATYVARAKMEEYLRACGFRHQPGKNAGRWLSPANEIFDISFAGDHLGGTGSSLDALAIASAIRLPGDPPTRHLSGAGFLMMKAAAFNDRGAAAPHESKDLTDIGVLVIGRPQLTLEVEAADAAVRRAVGSASALLLGARDLAPALRGHFSDRGPILPDTPDELTVEVIRVLENFRARFGNAASE